MNVENTKPQSEHAAKLEREWRAATTPKATNDLPSRGYSPRVVILDDPDWQRWNSSTWLLLGAVLLVPLALFIIVGSFESSYVAPGGNGSQSRVVVGQEAHVTSEILFVSKAAVDEARTVGGNTRALAAMAMGGQMLGVNVGARVIVLDNVGDGIFKVRVLEGEMVGRTGYVARGQLAP